MDIQKVAVDMNFRNVRTAVQTLTTRRPLQFGVFHPLHIRLHQLWWQPSFQQGQKKLEILYSWSVKCI